MISKCIHPTNNVLQNSMHELIKTLLEHSQTQEVVVLTIDAELVLMLLPKQRNKCLGTMPASIGKLLF